MKRYTVLILVVYITIFSSINTTSAQTNQSIKCSGCHKKLSRVIPSSHNNYKVEPMFSCFICHKINGKAKPLGEKIHIAHLQKKPDIMANCFSCHIARKTGEVSFPGYPTMKADKESMQPKTTFFNSWMQSPYLDNFHRKVGVYCLGCHTNYMDELEVTETQEKCIQCHGNYDELIAKTNALKYENNPHKSHYPDLKCSACHHGHKEFTDYCAQCHQFGYKIKERK